MRRQRPSLQKSASTISSGRPDDEGFVGLRRCAQHRPSPGASLASSQRGPITTRPGGAAAGRWPEHRARSRGVCRRVEVAGLCAPGHADLSRNASRALDGRNCMTAVVINIHATARDLVLKARRRTAPNAMTPAHHSERPTSPDNHAACGRRPTQRTRPPSC